MVFGGGVRNLLLHELGTTVLMKLHSSPNRAVHHRCLMTQSKGVGQGSEKMLATMVGGCKLGPECDGVEGM